MLKRTDAAYITGTGRGFLQVGNDEIFDEFQSGWSGAPYTPEVPFSDDSKAKASDHRADRQAGGSEEEKEEKRGQCEEIHPVRRHGPVCGKAGRGKSHQTSPSDLAAAASGTSLSGGSGAYLG